MTYRVFTSLLILFCAIFSPKQSGAQKKILRDTVIGGFSSPESVISDGKFIYVSNVGAKLEPMAKDSDGFISKLNPEGKVLDLKFIRGLNAPKGMAISANKLYVTDIDKVKGFDLSSGKEIFSLSFEADKVYFLNDLCLKDPTHLFVSSTDKNAIYEIDLKAKSYKKLAFADTINGPNGLFYDAAAAKLYVAGFSQSGRVYEVNLNSKKGNTARQIVNIGGSFDGLHVNKTTLFVSDWKSGKVIVLKNWSKEMKEQTKEEFPAYFINGPADFFYSEKNSRLYLPEMQKGNLHILHIK
jgi:DNA-binding beta-propeller fold protein YncE